MDEKTLLDSAKIAGVPFVSLGVLRGSRSPHRDRGRLARNLCSWTETRVHPRFGGASLGSRCQRHRETRWMRRPCWTAQRSRVSPSCLLVSFVDRDRLTGIAGVSPAACAVGQRQPETRPHFESHPRNRSRLRVRRKSATLSAAGQFTTWRQTNFGRGGAGD